MTSGYFGTDGIRGRVGEAPVTADFMLKLGWAAGKVQAIVRLCQLVKLFRNGEPVQARDDRLGRPLQPVEVLEPRAPVGQGLRLLPWPRLPCPRLPCLCRSRRGRRPCLNEELLSRLCTWLIERDHLCAAGASPPRAGTAAVTASSMRPARSRARAGSRRTRSSSILASRAACSCGLIGS